MDGSTIIENSNTKESIQHLVTELKETLHAPVILITKNAKGKWVCGYDNVSLPEMQEVIRFLYETRVEDMIEIKLREAIAFRGGGGLVR